MPDNLIEQLKRAKEQVTLAEDRKAAIRARIVETIDSRVRATDALRRPVHAQQARSFGFLARMRVITAVVAVVLVGGAGVSFAAQDALPGDVLYPVKIGVNENVQEALAFSIQAKAQVAISHAENRLDEVSSLSAQGRLDAETETRLRANFEERSQVAEAAIEKLHERDDLQGAASAAVRFEGVLRVHHAVLASLEEDDQDTSGTGGDETDLNNSIRDRIAVLAGLRAHLEMDISEDAARLHVSDALKAAVSAMAFLQEKNNTGDNASARAEVEAKAAVQFAADAQAALDAGSYNTAFVLSNKAIGTAAEARSLATASAHLNGHAKRDGALGDLFKGQDDDEEASSTINGSSTEKIDMNVRTNASSRITASERTGTTESEDKNDDTAENSGRSNSSSGSGVLHFLGF